jgi:phosphoribosylformylglycinamidine cyclo-ligase
VELKLKFYIFLTQGKVVKDNLFDIPELFKLIQAESGTSWREMYKVFNMGHRMEIYMNPSAAEKAISISKKFNIDAKIIGRVEPQEKPQVHLKAPDGWHIYDIQ